MKININDTVKVELTKTGIKIFLEYLKERYGELSSDAYGDSDRLMTIEKDRARLVNSFNQNNIILEVQLYDIINIFGCSFKMGGEVPFGELIVEGTLINGDKIDE